MPQQQEFHTGDVKSVRNLVRNSDWSTGYIFYVLFTKDRQKATNVTCKWGHKCDESTTTQPIFLEYFLVERKHLSFATAHSQCSTKLYHNQPGET